eukprot:CAMPEP_0114987086 /NCGR_PEP_ID=MMETSP0216-20121206/8805_1 /TAXON_ID=223996 /ORGANISM="Protocruzia adherens, Strain Boccale" /LENGTH=175 /DNA_ID=CAMNT_0002349631 /DNA_START=401 /DNA_END=928 /DNA_ORIENTATION=-
MKPTKIRSSEDDPSPVQSSRQRNRRHLETTNPPTDQNSKRSRSNPNSGKPKRRMPNREASNGNKSINPNSKSMTATYRILGQHNRVRTFTIRNRTSKNSVVSDELQHHQQNLIGKKAGFGVPVTKQEFDTLLYHYAKRMTKGKKSTSMVDEDPVVKEELHTIMQRYDKSNRPQKE